MLELISEESKVKSKSSPPCFTVHTTDLWVMKSIEEGAELPHAALNQRNQKQHEQRGHITTCCFTRGLDVFLRKKNVQCHLMLRTVSGRDDTDLLGTFNVQTLVFLLVCLFILLMMKYYLVTVSHETISFF